MYINFFKIFFMIIGLILVILLSMRSFISSKIEDNLKVSVFVTVIAGFLLLYIILAIILTFILPENWYKIIMLFFAVSPFIIGKLASYEKIKIFSIIQILLAAISVICVYLF